MGQRARAGSARTCPFRASEGRRDTFGAARQLTLQSAAEARRYRGAASAAGSPQGVLDEALLSLALDAVDVLDLPPQLWCGETGRSALNAGRPVSAWVCTRFYARGATACGVGGGT